MERKTETEKNIECTHREKSKTHKIFATKRNLQQNPMHGICVAHRLASLQWLVVVFVLCHDVGVVVP